MTVRREIAQSPSETGARSHEAGQHHAWEFRRGHTPFVGILQGGWPPCRSGRGRLQSRARDGREAYLKRYVDRLNGELACLDAGSTASRLSQRRIRDCSRSAHE
jgi:hypothetical protein